MADDDGVAVAVARTGAVVAGLGHRTACRSVNGRTGGGTNIHALVAAAVPAGAVPVAGHRPDKLTSAGDIGCTGGNLFGAHRNFFSHRLLGHHSAQNLLGKLIAVCIVHPLCRHGADAVLALLGNALGTGVQLFGLGGFGGIGDFFLPAFHLGDAHLQRLLLPHHGQCIAGQDLGVLGQAVFPVGGKAGVHFTQFLHGQAVFLGNRPDGIAALHRIGFFRLLHAGEQLLHLGFLLEALVEVDAVFQRDILVKAHGGVGVIGVLVGFQQAADVPLQAVAVRTHGGQLTVQIQGSALADLVAGILEDGVSHVIFVHHVMGDGHGISRLHGKVRLLCAGIIDTLLHGFQRRIEHLFVGHIAHGLVVHLHLQSVGLADGGLEHGHHNSQRCHRQHIHSHAGHKADVVSDAMGKKVAACAQRSTKAVFLAYPVCVAQQRPGAPQGKHYRAEQIPQQLRRPGKGHGCDIFQQFSDRLQQTP